MRAFKYRIYPTEVQKTALNQFFGNCRFTYNKALEHKKSVYNSEKKSVSYNKMSTEFLGSLKSEFDFLKLSPSQSLQQSLRHLDNAYQRFFKKLANFPVFKSRYNRQSISFPQFVTVDWKNNRIIFPKLKAVSAVLHRKFKGVIKTVTLSKNKDGKYYASILVDDGNISLPKKKTVRINDIVALDLGVKSIICDDKGNKTDSEKYLRKELGRLQYYDKVISGKKKGSNNRKKLQIKKNRLLGKITRKRDDFLHKLSSRIISNNHVVILEDLGIKEMLKSAGKTDNISEVQSRLAEKGSGSNR